MEARAAIDPGLPVTSPTASFWQEPPDDIAILRSTPELPTDVVDYVIIGSGITGSTLAFELLTALPLPTATVMLEARQTCSGATGRNGRFPMYPLSEGGHTKSANYRLFKHNLETVGVVDAIKIARLEYNNIRAVHEFKRTHNIPCDLRSIDSVDIFLDEQKYADAVAAVAFMQQNMLPAEPAAVHTIWSAEEARTKFKTPKACGAITFAAGSLVPYKLVCAILKMCLGKGLNLQTSTPATNIIPLRDSAAGRYIVETPRGNIRAHNVILATNGHTSHLYAPLRSSIVPLRGQVTLHTPPEGSEFAEELPTTYSMIYKTGYDYMIQHPSTRDIVIGGGLSKAQDEGMLEYGQTDDAELEKGVSVHLHATMREYFRNHWSDGNGDDVTREWTGIMGFSADGYPWVGKTPDAQEGLWLAASFQGHGMCFIYGFQDGLARADVVPGMVLCFLCARALAHMILGKDERQLMEWFPQCFLASEERLRTPFVGRA